MTITAIHWNRHLFTLVEPSCTTFSHHRSYWPSNTRSCSLCLVHSCCFYSSRWGWPMNTGYTTRHLCVLRRSYQMPNHYLHQACWTHTLGCLLSDDFGNNLLCWNTNNNVQWHTGMLNTYHSYLTIAIQMVVL